VSTQTLVSKLRDAEQRHGQINQSITDANVDSKLMGQLSRELTQLEPLLDCYHRYQSLQAELQSLQSLIDSVQKDGSEEAAELANLAASELADTQAKVTEVMEEVTSLLLPKEEADERNVILEIRAGTGGDEAMLFVGDLLGMYERYCQRAGYEWQPLAVNEADISGGFREASISISGPGAFGRLKHERGVHRVQVP
jgi:peptide chain release factor 1